MLLSSSVMVLKVVCVLVHRSQWTWEVGLCASKFFPLIVKTMCLGARVFWCCRCGGCVRCSIQQPRCRCVSAIFFARCHNIVETPQKVTGALRFQKLISPMFAFVIHSETQSVVTHLFLPWRGIVGDWRQQHRFSVPLQTHMLRDAVSLQFAKTTPAISQIGVRGVFVCEGVGDNQCFDFVGKAQKG